MVLLLGGCAPMAQRAAGVCLVQAEHADPDQEPTTQGHDHAQALMGACMEARGYTFDWNKRRCDAQYPTTITKGVCYRRPGELI